MQEKKVGEVLRRLKNRLEPKFGYEAESIALILIEDALGVERTDLLLNKSIVIEPAKNKLIEDHVKELFNDVPVQHLLGHADFYGYKFKVDDSVLVPRQETEELVLIVSEFVRSKNYKSILDIGTGSGCIAISLALEDKKLDVSAIDVSEIALEIAKFNSKSLEASVSFSEMNILHDDPIGSFDVIVSNPPYVLESERKLLQANVLDYDPEIALFVPDNKPLIFYERITEIAAKQLNENGLLFFEINEKFGLETKILLEEFNFTGVSLRKDLNNKDRFVYGFKNQV